MIRFLIAAFLLITSSVSAQEKWSERMATTAMRLWPDSFLIGNDKTAKWRYDQGVILKGMEDIWMSSGKGAWFHYIQRSMDHYINEDGSIRGYRADEYNIDHVNNGKLLLMLYQVTGREKYHKAADRLRQQLVNHPRTTQGGFWHKKIYPNQMWLDGLYMGQPFYAEYAKIFQQDTVFNDVVRQFVLMEANARDSKTGLLYHGWDESKTQQWADKKTGRSPHVWGRSLGWYGMALVDVLDHIPTDHPQRVELIAILRRFATSIRDVQDRSSGLWYDIPDMPDAPKNYPEASVSCMLAYTLAKGARKGYLPSACLTYARQAYQGILKSFIEVDSNGQVNLKGTVAVSGLGGNPYRDGSFTYYMSEPVIVNDPKGIGAFILCASEIERNETTIPDNGKIVLLDRFFNNEWKKNSSGEKYRWHYTWEDRTNSGYSLLGELFRQQGATTKSLDTAPSMSTLNGSSIYIIVDPDTEKETDHPNFISDAHIESILSWVHNGGVLVLLGNDAGNSEFKRFNQLSTRFGIQFLEESKNRVTDNVYEGGAVQISEEHIIFHNARQLFIKELSPLRVTTPATVLLSKNDDVVMAVSKFGKGTVFALGDPWIYNEYLDGRKLPSEFDNYRAAIDWIQWLLKQTK